MPGGSSAHELDIDQFVLEMVRKHVGLRATKTKASGKAELYELLGARLSERVALLYALAVWKPKAIKE